MRQYRIGLLVTHSNIDYPQSLRMGIQNVIEEAGHTLVHIAELIPYHTLTNAERRLRVAFQIAARLDLDVVIAPVGCMTAYLRGDNSNAMQIMQVLDPAKTLVLERSIPGYRCITKDNDPGMRECMRHLIETCGFTRIAFISGPENSKGAHDRETIYFEEMAAHGLEVSPPMFARGDFGGDCADVVQTLLDDNPDLEAIACACDLIAYTVYAVLRDRKLSVGHDIAVTGFDDNPRSRHLDPPLSTVHMTSYDYGCMAAREALRMCEGAPQEEATITSRFIPRNSCGENVRGGVEYFRELLRQKPFPTDEFVSIMMDSTLMMAGPRVASDFRSHMETFFSKVRASYIRHRESPSIDDLLFSSHDLSMLLHRDYRENLSLEGFHSVAITLLEALLEESPKEDSQWVIEQISYLHLRIARLLNSGMQNNALVSDKREWVSFQMVDDALREDGNLAVTYERMLGELVKLGVDEGDVLLLPEPVEVTGARAFALSDTLTYVGRIVHGNVEVDGARTTLMMPEMLTHVLARYGKPTMCTVGALMAGNELLGVAVLRGDSLNVHGQLIAMLNLGCAFKHLQMIANEREMNQLLNQNNLLLKQQSQHDELTGLLNRRGFTNRLEHLLGIYEGRHAAVMYLDLDGLKTINDTLGHDMGDEAIRSTARILKSCMPEGGVLSRQGGDEFAAFVLTPNDEQINELAHEVQAAMDDFNATHNNPYTLAISVGSASFDIEKSTSSRIPDLMALADERLYDMKRRHKLSRRFAASP